MALTSFFESLFKWLFLLSALTMTASYVYKDKIPDPEYYDVEQLDSPRQMPTDDPAFTTQVNGQEYTIMPRFSYELDGVVVSYHDADAFGDIWHHKRWKDFINLRDICVIWGGNVTTGVYQHMKFSNDSWTCWAYWPDQETGSQFQMNALSNNHLLTDDDAVKSALMSAEPGDHIRLKGVLAEYANKASGFQRGTSTIREDTGNGACETIYVDGFKIINKANRKSRRLFALAKWLTLISAVGFSVMFVIAPVKNRF